MALSAPNVAPKPKLPAFRSGLSTKGSKGLQFGTAGTNPDLPRIGKPMGTSKHPGFAAVQNKIAKKEGVSEKSAGAILASATRGASAGAKKKNPFLKHVK
jgi:hypothetical protein